MSSTAQNYPSTQYRERDDLGVAPTAQRFWSECNKLSDLIAEHDDLDQAVTSMLSAFGCDDLAISRLKKRKLRVRDEISQARAYLRSLTESLAQSGATISRTAISCNRLLSLNPPSGAFSGAGGKGSITAVSPERG